MAKKSLNETSPVARFEQSLEELEQLVQKMEVGDLSWSNRSRPMSAASGCTAIASRRWNRQNCACAC